MNKKTKDMLIIFFNNILKKSDLLNYQLVDFDDDDVNFLVTPKIKSLKKYTDDQFMFILYCSDKTIMTIYCPTLYSLKNNDSAMFTLNAINNVNSKISIGKIYLNSINSSVISYVSTALFNDITKELTSNVLKEYIDSFIYTCIEFYKQMKVDINHENN